MQAIGQVDTVDVAAADRKAVEALVGSWRRGAAIESIERLGGLYSAMSDPAWDLADVAVEADLDDDGVEHLLAAYGDEKLDRDLRRRVEALGPVTDVVWGLWAFVQEANGNRAEDFATYGRVRLDRAARTLG